MKRADLWRYSIATTLEAEDAVMEILGAVLAQPVSSWHDLETGLIRAAVYSTKKPRNLKKVRGQIRAGLAGIKECGLNIAPARLAIGKIRHEDWAESWKRHFTPIEISPALLIKPGWSRRRPRKNQQVVILDPGLSFGTGRHPTTEFCLRELARVSEAEIPRSFLDIGTGSGILAIAAAKLGYSPVDAFDFDPAAVRIARANARANGVAAKIRFSRADITRLPLHGPRQYNLICANLISTLLIGERCRIMNRLCKSGTLVLAGILEKEFSTLQKSFAEIGLKLAGSKVGNEWRSGTFRFRVGRF